MDDTSEPDIFEQICTPSRGINRETLETVIVLAVEIAREGREGRRIGTLFTVGDADEVLKRSRPLILDPLYGHPREKRLLLDPDTRETIKELAQLDGAFVISDDGVAVSACRYLTAPDTDQIKLPLGLGSRHVAAASVSYHTSTVGVVVSESSVVRVFDNGELISEIIPELWMLRHYSLHVSGKYRARRSARLTVVSKEEE
jgi:DNA integrity scanning protein DisA with diadenylate cyclase activity